jgi:L-alanine-DL-glutamate epimerase-like enolase superfamily enzyme
MQVLQVDVIKLRNNPKAKKKADSNESGAETASSDYSIFIRITASIDEQDLIGLGEARPSAASTETVSQAFKNAARIAKHIAGREFELGIEQEGGPEMQVHATVQRIMSSIFGVSGDIASNPRPSPSVCYAVECALLDIIAKHQGITVQKLVTGHEGNSIPRNVFNEDLSDTGNLMKGISTGKVLKGWYRQGRRIKPVKASSLVNSILFALGGKQHEVEGLMLNGGQSWEINGWKNFCDELATLGLAEMQGVQVAVEDPFPELAESFYQQAFEYARDKNIRIMLAKPVWGPESIRKLASYIPHVDLKITPQKAGGFHAVLETERTALDLGFKGSVFLGNAPTTTNFNSITLVALANALKRCRYFSATFKKEGKVHLVHPRPDRVRNQIIVPAGDGWGTNICRSALRKRLDSVYSFHAGGRYSERIAKVNLLEGAVDDRLPGRQA